MKYSDAGVNIDKGNAFVKMIKPAAESTVKKGVLSGIGGFAGLWEIDQSRYSHPVIVTSTDGVGTKLRIAFMMGIHDTIGIDLVAMNVNDIVVSGAEPVTFLDYIAVSKLKPDIASGIIKGIVKGCKEAKCVLIGGETAELPGFYNDNEYELAGFAVGIVDKADILKGSDIKQGDVLIGISSNGLHSNGYSLTRHILLKQKKMKLSAYVDELGCTLGEELLKPTIIYAGVISALVRRNLIKAAAHITGGGIMDNLLRALPSKYTAVIKTGSWYIPPIFEMLRCLGNIDDMEMIRAFNCGIGMIVVASENNADAIMRLIKTRRMNAYVIGKIIRSKTNKHPVEFV